MMPHAFGRGAPLTVGVEEELWSSSRERSFRPGPGRASRRRAPQGRAPPRGRRADDRDLRRRERGAGAAPRGARRGAPAGRVLRRRPRRLRHLAARRRELLQHHAGARLPRVRRVRRARRAPPDLCGPPRPRRGREPGGVHGRARVGAPLASGAPRGVGELALPRGRGDGARLDARRAPRAPAARRDAARVRVVRGVRPVRRAAGHARPRGLLAASLVGRAPASRLRDARGARPGPADAGRGLGRLRGARPGDGRDCRAGPPADRALYVQNRFAALRFGARAELVHPDGARLVAAPDLLAELVELVAPPPSASGRPASSLRSRVSPRRTSSSSSGGEAACGRSATT